MGVDSPMTSTRARTPEMMAKPHLAHHLRLRLASDFAANIASAEIAAMGQQSGLPPCNYALFIVELQAA